MSEDKIENERNPLSLFGELPQRRLEIRVGKFSMPDFFDQNSAGSDTHLQFLNWTVDNNGAYDYAADTRGYTVGAVADYEDPKFSLKFAEALMPKVANGIDLVWKPWEAHAENLEFDWHHGILPKKSGVIRLLGYTNHANMGIYRQLWPSSKPARCRFRISPIIPGTSRSSMVSESTWSRIFPRTSWPSRAGAGTTAGLSHSPTPKWTKLSWKVLASMARSGIASRIAPESHSSPMAICKDHQTYLADGGLGFLLGDGHLTYGRENIVEAYYTAHVWRGIYLAPGVQHINNPGYNQDRGPVTVPSFRAHVEF